MLPKRLISLVQNRTNIGLLDLQSFNCTPVLRKVWAGGSFSEAGTPTSFSANETDPALAVSRNLWTPGNGNSGTLYPCGSGSSHPDIEVAKILPDTYGGLYDGSKALAQ